MKTLKQEGLCLWCLTPLLTIFQLYRGSTREKLPTCCKSLTNNHIMLLRVHLLWVRFELTTLVVIDTDCIGSYRSTTIRSRPRRALSNGYWVIWLAIQKYHTVRKSNTKTQKEAKSIPLTHIYMTVHFHGL